MMRAALVSIVSVALVAACASVSATPSPNAATQPASSTAVVPPASTAPPSASAAGRTVSCPAGVQGQAGTFAVHAADATPVPLEVTLTQGWDGCSLFYKEMPVAGGGTAPAMVGFWLVGNVYEDPCRWKTTRAKPAVGQSVDELATALDRQRLTDAEPAVAVTLDGFVGLRVEFAVPDDVDVAHCDRGQIAEFRYWDGAHLDPAGRPIQDDSVFWLGAADAPGRVNEAWIVDVDGIRFVAQTARTRDMAPAVRDELHGIVESIDFRPG